MEAVCISHSTRQLTRTLAVQVSEHRWKRDLGIGGSVPQLAPASRWHDDDAHVDLGAVWEVNAAGVVLPSQLSGVYSAVTSQRLKRGWVAESCVTASSWSLECKPNPARVPSVGESFPKRG